MDLNVQDYRNDKNTSFDALTNASLMMDKVYQIGHSKDFTVTTKMNINDGSYCLTRPESDSDTVEVVEMRITRSCMILLTAYSYFKDSGKYDWLIEGAALTEDDVVKFFNHIN